MEKGRSKQIIDRLVDMVENGKKAPFSSSKVIINKDEAVLLLKEMENIVNGELKIYRELNDKRGRIISEAKNEARDIVYEAKETASRIRVSKRMPSIVGFREDKLDVEEKNILRTANDIYAASLIYTDEMLTEANDIIAEAYDLIYNQYGKMVAALEEKAKLIADNKAELMTNLKELSKEERYEQILDLGRLLSSELYYERERAKKQERQEFSVNRNIKNNINKETENKKINNTYQNRQADNKPDIEDIPDSGENKEDMPYSGKKKEDMPDVSRNKEAIPDSSKKKEAMPDSGKKKEDISDSSRNKEDMPYSGKKKEDISDNSRNKEDMPYSGKRKEDMPDDSKKKEEIAQNGKI